MIACGLYQSPSYPMPPDVVGEVRRVAPEENAARVARYTQADACLTIGLKKLYDLPFVPPIDVPAGSKTENAEFRERYWTIFDNDRFQE